MKSKYICPILTSVNEDGTVNYEDMHAFYDRVLGAGINGVLTGGSAGEFYAFTYEEVKELMLDAVKYINHRGLVIAGTGRMAKSETISLSNELLQAGADAVMIVGPYYSGCNEEDVFHYYDEVMGKVEGNVYLYNYADRTGYDVPSSTILRLLAKHKNFIGVKDTYPVLRHTQKYIQDIKPVYPEFQIFTGYDNNCIPAVMSGGDGCIGALSNVYPDMGHQVTVALEEEALPQLIALQRQIDTYFKFYEVHVPFNPVMKWALVEMGYPMKEFCKEPLTILTKEEKELLAPVADQLWRKRG